MQLSCIIAGWLISLVTCARLEDGDAKPKEEEKGKTTGSADARVEQGPEKKDDKKPTKEDTGGVKQEPSEEPSPAGKFFEGQTLSDGGVVLSVLDCGAGLIWRDESGGVLSIRLPPGLAKSGRKRLLPKTFLWKCPGASGKAASDSQALPWNFAKTNALVFSSKDLRKIMTLADFVKERKATSVSKHTPTFAAGTIPPKLSTVRDLRLSTTDPLAQRIISKVGAGGTTHTCLAWAVGIKDSSVVIPVGACLYVTKQLHVSEEETRL